MSSREFNDWAYELHRELGLQKLVDFQNFKDIALHYYERIKSDGYEEGYQDGLDELTEPTAEAKLEWVYQNWQGQEFYETFHGIFLKSEYEMFKELVTEKMADPDFGK